MFNITYDNSNDLSLLWKFHLKYSVIIAFSCRCVLRQVQVGQKSFLKARPVQGLYKSGTGGKDSCGLRFQCQHSKWARVFSEVWLKDSHVLEIKVRMSLGTD